MEIERRSEIELLIHELTLALDCFASHPIRFETSSTRIPGDDRLGVEMALSQPDAVSTLSESVELTFLSSAVPPTQ